MRLRILSYNVHGLPWVLCPIKSILNWIRIQTECDVVCLQEVFTKSLIEQITQFAPWFGWNVYWPQTESCFGKRYLGFYCPSGLCTLVKQGISVSTETFQESFTERGGVDRFVRKGFFAIKILKDGAPFTIINTHFQSDLTDIPPLRINYPALRTLQEQQLHRACQRYKNPICCGDFNQDSFFFFEKFDSEKNITFPETQEHLDHILVPADDAKNYTERKTIYFHSMNLSDHIPVFFEFSWSAS